MTIRDNKIIKETEEDLGEYIKNKEMELNSISRRLNHLTQQKEEIITELENIFIKMEDVESVKKKEIVDELDKIVKKEKKEK
jgi:hypothetical protein